MNPQALTTSSPRIFKNITLLAVFVLTNFIPLTSFSKSEGDQITQLIAPADLVATYTCIGVSETIFATEVIDRFKVRATEKPLTHAELTRIINQFDLVIAEFCKETRQLYLAKKEIVAEVVAKNLPALESTELSKIAEGKSAQDWFIKNKNFLTKTLPITIAYKFANELAPHLLEPSLQTRSTLQFSTIRDEQQLYEFKLIVTGDTELLERNMIFRLLSDDSFRRLLPSTYDFKLLQSLESETRKEGVSIFKKSTASLYSLSARYQAMRMNFMGFDVMRSMGLQEPYVAAQKSITKIRL